MRHNLLSVPSWRYGYRFVPGTLPGISHGVVIFVLPLGLLAELQRDTADQQSFLMTENSQLTGTVSWWLTWPIFRQRGTRR
jgi:hypothetical protein